MAKPKAPKAPKAPIEKKSGKFLSSKDARKAALKIEGEEGWAEDMSHEESTEHHNAINRSA